MNIYISKSILDKEVKPAVNIEKGVQAYTKGLVWF